MPISEGLWNHFLEDDTYRRDVAIVSEDELAQDLEEAGASCDPIIDITQNNPNDFTGYWQEKYSNYKAYAGTNVNGGNEHLTKAQNTHVFRYADVLLMLAEALHRGSGSDSEAMLHIDMVRERAAGPGDNGGSFRTSSVVMAEEAGPCRTSFGTSDAPNWRVRRPLVRFGAFRTGQRKPLRGRRQQGSQLRPRRPLASHRL